MIGEKRIISLCISRLHDLENARFIMELNQSLHQHNCSLWIYNINTDLYWNDTTYNAETSVFDLLDYDHTDVVIVMDEKIKSRAISDRIIERTQARGIPVIIADGSHEGCAEVRFDYGCGFEQVIRHVMEEHHVRRPHFIGGAPDDPFSNERLAIFRSVVMEYGISFDKTMVSYGYFWAKPAKAAAEEILTREILPDAILCANDIMAINVVSVLTEHGIRVPEDIIVTGFDGIDEINFMTPTITSARCGTSGMSGSIYQAVLDALDGCKPRHYMVKPQLLRNCSCGCLTNESAALGHLHSFNDRFYRYQDDNRALSNMCERMQSFDSIEESSYTLFGDVLQDMCCIINKRCIDYTTDYFTTERVTEFDDTMLLFLDTDQIPFLQRDIARSEIIPNLEDIMAQGYPLIFNSLSFMNVPLGYLCFHFREYEITDYCKIPQIATSLSLGLGGFINRQYQSYLTRKIETMYRYDALTGLSNRMSFSKDFAVLCESRGDEGIPLTIVLSDLDGLKPINDLFGHAAGDNAIHTVAQALLSACPPDALCVRFGGDEMVAVIPGACDSQTLVQRITDHLDAYNASSGLAYQISTSVGVSQTTLRRDTDFEALLRKADLAMYSIKQEKKLRK